MGKMDVAIRSYLTDRRRFADLFNGIFFEGRPVIQAADLQEASEQYTGTRDVFYERFRDIKMTLCNGETLRILSLENQTHIDYTMPYRCMEYDTLEYSRQLQQVIQHNKEKKLLHSPAERLCGFTATDRLSPVYTLCLYHGVEPWNGPLSLRDMMDFGKDVDGMSRFFADYPFRLFCVNEHTDFQIFHTELREVFTAMNCRKNKEQLHHAMCKNPAFQRLDEATVKVLSVVLNLPALWNNRSNYINRNQKNREEFDMCQAMRELLEDAKAVGINEGISQGISQGAEEKTHTIVMNMLKRNMALEDICALAECSEEFVAEVKIEL